MTSAKYNSLTAEEVRFRLDYKHETGEFFWKNSKQSRRNGLPAGNVQKIGYHIISIDKVHYLSHRLAWCHYYGEWPELLIDHINGVKTDNRIENLRLATKQENNFNSTMWKSNKSGYKGVFWNSQKQKWQARATLNYKAIYLGTFDDAEDASKAYHDFVSKKHGVFYNPDSLRNKHVIHRLGVNPTNL